MPLRKYANCRCILILCVKSGYEFFVCCIPCELLDKFMPILCNFQSFISLYPKLSVQTIAAPHIIASPTVRPQPSVKEGPK